MNTTPQLRVPPTVLTTALIAFSAFWFAAAGAFHVANRTSKDGVFGAPVWALLVLTLVPLSTCLLAPWLLRARRCGGEGLRAIDYCALVAGIAPFAFVAVVVLVISESK